MNIKLSMVRQRINSGVQTTRQNHESIDQILTQLSKQGNSKFQQMVTQLCTHTQNLEKKLQKQTDVTPVSQERNSNSPIKRASLIRRNSMYINKHKVEPTPRQRILQRRNSIEQNAQRSQLDYNYIHGMADFNLNGQSAIPPSLAKLTQLTNQTDEETYEQIIRMEYQEFQSSVYEVMRFSRDYIIKSQQVLMKLKRMVTAMVATKEDSASDTFGSLSKMLCSVLECDRAGVYMHDQKHNQVWSKEQEQVSKTTLVHQGLVAYVMKNGQLININDAYADVRFDPEYDINMKLKHKTKAIMACPIVQNDGSVGVVLASQSSAKQFQREDEQLIQQMAQYSLQIVKPYTQVDYTSKLAAQLHTLINSAILLLQSKDQKHIIQLGTSILRKKYDIKQVQIYLKDMQDPNSLFTFNDQGIRKKISKTCGIVGQVFSNAEYHVSDSCYRDKYYNNIADLETHLPTISIPIMYKQSCMGVIQFLDTKGIDNLITKQALKPQQATCFELIMTFAQMLAQINNKYIVSTQHQF